jgi:cyclopropane fatty-acyl-phospholipid synthase-like methyltransferase
VQFLYDEQYRERCYLQHGVCLGPGATVIDVGANIGMFSMFAAEVSQYVLCTEVDVSMSKG